LRNTRTGSRRPVTTLRRLLSVLLISGVLAVGTTAGGASAHPVFGPLHRYLYATGPAPAWQDAVIYRESGWDPSATNPYSGAAGLAQFLWSTWYWAEGYCGIWGSPYDAYAAIDMMNCLVADGQYYHWYCGGQPGCYDISVRGRYLP
jgi:hypothetical protein